MVRLRKSRGTDGRGDCTQPLTGLPPCGEALQRVRTAPLGPPSLPLCADLGLLRLLDRNRAQGSRALREGKGPAQRARPEEVVHVPSGGTARTNHSRHTWEDKARALPLTRPFGRSCDFGGRSCSKIMKLLLKVEAAGIEPASESTRPGRTTCLA